MAKSKILYIAGAGRSGSTLLEILLGNLPNYFSIGEARHFFEYLPIDGKLCGCGSLLASCPFWSAVSEQLQRNPDVDLERAARLSLALNRTRHTWQLQSGPRSKQWKKDTVELVGYLSHLYHAVWQQSGQKIIVDSSKVPSHLHLLSQVEDLDLRTLHLLRDGRAVAYSWSKRRKRQPAPGGGYVELPQRSPYRAMTTWMAENLLVSRIGRRLPWYTTLYYESFTENPQKVLAGSLNELGLKADLALLNNDELDLNNSHSVGGNPLRFQQKRQKIVRDEKWRIAMDPLTKTAITLLGAPLLLRYGYLLE